MTSPVHDPRGEAVARETFRLVVGSVFSLPLLAGEVAERFGFYVFFFGDVKIRFVWTTAVVAGAGWAFFTGAWAALRARRPSPDLAFAPLIAAVYAHGVYNTFFNPLAATGVGAPAFYEALAGGILLVVAAQLLIASVRSRRRGPAG